jgi:flagellar basal body-associated protein FliL
VFTGNSVKGGVPELVWIALAIVIMAVVVIVVTLMLVLRKKGKSKQPLTTQNSSAPS